MYGISIGKYIAIYNLTSQGQITLTFVYTVLYQNNIMKEIHDAT